MSKNENSDVNEVRVKELVKEALTATDSLQYPDLLMYIAQNMLRGPLDNVLERLQNKDMVDLHSDAMGTVITRIKKKKGKK